MSNGKYTDILKDRSVSTLKFKKLKKDLQGVILRVLRLVDWKEVTTKLRIFGVVTNQHGVTFQKTWPFFYTLWELEFLKLLNFSDYASLKLL